MNKRTLLQCKLFVFDMDGTLILGNKPLSCARELIEYMRRSNRRFVIVTNNSSEPNEKHAKNLSRILGIKITADEIYSSLDHLGNYLKKHGMIENVFPLLTRSSKRYLHHKYGVKFSDKSPRLVVVGFDKELTYSKLADACIFIQKGVPWVLVHPDLRCPAEAGYLPDAGSIGKAIELTTGTRPIAILGKPSSEMLIEISLKNNVSTREVCYIGDRIYTDIRMAVESNAIPILVLSGEATLQDLISDVALQEKRILVFKDLCDLLDALGAMCSSSENLECI
jgi:HAD superfamily hydrolase (TIGR01450 family)